MDQSARRGRIRIVPGRGQALRRGRFQWLDFWGLDLNGIGEIEVIDLVAGRRLRGGSRGTQDDYDQEKYWFSHVFANFCGALGRASEGLGILTRTFISCQRCCAKFRVQPFSDKLKLEL